MGIAPFFLTRTQLTQLHEEGGVPRWGESESSPTPSGSRSSRCSPSSGSPRPPAESAARSRPCSASGPADGEGAPDAQGACPGASPPGEPETTAERLVELRGMLRAALNDAPPQAVAGLAREYRATIEEIDRLEGGDGGDPVAERSTPSPPGSPRRCSPVGTSRRRSGHVDLLDEVVDFAKLIGYGVGDWQRTPLADWSRLDARGQVGAPQVRAGQVPRQAGQVARTRSYGRPSSCWRWATRCCGPTTTTRPPARCSRASAGYSASAQATPTRRAP